MATSDFPDDIQFAGLVQAATAAADDEQTRTTPNVLGKRKRGGYAPDKMPSVPVLRGHESSDVLNERAMPQLLSSATVLFREPSEKSKKYSRPPLGKVYASLELAPETFLRLQAAAKAFMLDPAHPDRRDVIGHKKHSGGADVAKLRLWNCVEEFLTLYGHGQTYFGRGAGQGIPGAPPRTMFWPEDSQKIIKLMMPLMRKMVTNERQRLYAAETRRQGSGKGRSGAQDRELDEEESQLHSTPPPHEETGQTVYADSGELPSESAAISSSAASLGPDVPSQTSSGSMMTTTTTTTTFKPSTVLHVNVVSNNGGALRRVAPRFSLTPEAAPSLSMLLAEASKHYNALHSRINSKPTVKVWLADGLVTITEDGEWMVALLSAGVVDWMDGEVRVLIQI